MISFGSRRCAAVASKSAIACSNFLDLPHAVIAALKHADQLELVLGKKDRVMEKLRKVVEKLEQLSAAGGQNGKKLVRAGDLAAVLADRQWLS